ncbi:MAG: DUF1015 family protein [Phycisphaerales bacterium JB039]
MPAVYPFAAVQYSSGRGDVSRFVAPPYDVIDTRQKAELLSHDPRNVVAIDLPHTPAKELGPPAAYQGAAEQYRAWLAEGALSRRDTPAMFAYRQSFDFRGDRYQRCGMACCVQTVPFGPREGGGVLPHEQTFSGPKEDRLALMKATSAQFSPIFSLHADDTGAATALLHKVMAARKPDMTADLGDGVLHEVWTIDDTPTIGAYRDALAGEDIFIADGHHRYNTALNYLASLEAAGPVPADHPARRTMMVLVGMSDPGLAIGPTHRVLGAMKDYSLNALRIALDPYFTIQSVGAGARAIEQAVADHPANAEGRSVLGLIDFASGECFTCALKDADPLARDFADKPRAWRTLDVALVQHLIVEKICEPKLNGGQPVKWAFPHSVAEALEIGSGAETGAGGGAGFAQFAVIVRPTPLEAVKEISRAGELMPQKSTFFYPKLATGLFINPLA